MTAKQTQRIVGIAQKVKTGAEVTEVELRVLRDAAKAKKDADPSTVADQLLGDFHAQTGIFA